MKSKNILKYLSIRNFLPRTLFGRSLLILILPVLLIQIITTIVFFDRHWNRMTSRLSFAVAGEVTMLARTLERTGGNLQEMKQVVEDAARNLDISISFFADENLPLQKNKTFSPFVWESSVATALIKQLDHLLGRPYTLDIDFDENWIELRIQLDSGIMHVALPQRRMFSSSGYVFLLWMFGTSLLLLVIAILFMRNQVRPIRRLSVAAERFGKGHDVADFKPKGAREVRQAAEAFLIMRKRIKRQIEQRTTMLAGVSHDLRTPLTRLKLQVAMLEGSEDTAAMKDDIAEMEKMIDGYLEFVRGEGDEPMQRTPVNDLMGRAVQQSHAREVHFDKAASADINIQLRPRAMERCFTNLLNNAAKHASEIWIDIKREENKMLICVADNGPGIQPEKYEEVFRPFYRLESSRNKNTGGVGLGLAIARDIIHGHGGKIWLDKSRHGGLAVNIQLPL